jgi:hypothetical protein
MDKRTFVQLIKRATPLNSNFTNPGGGTSTIISHSDSYIYYQRGKSKIPIGYNDLFDVWTLFQNRMVTSTDLRNYRPSVFSSAENSSGTRGHSCNCTFLLIVFEAAGLVDHIEGQGKRGDPCRAMILARPIIRAPSKSEATSSPVPMVKYT